jgi:chromosome segregation ATPase
MRQTKVADDFVKELQLKFVSKIAELESSQDLIRKLRREYQSTRVDAEGMLRVMSGLEKQLAEYTSREAEVEKNARESRESVEEAITEMNKAQAREKQSRLEIEKLLNERRKINENMQNKTENAMSQAREKAMEQVRSCEGELTKMVSKVSIIEYQDRILSSMDSSLSKELGRVLKKQKMELLFSHKVSSISRNENLVNVLAYDKNEKEVKLEGDYCLISIGRRPYTEGLNLKAAGLDVNKKGQIEINENMQTQVDLFYLHLDLLLLSLTLLYKVFFL